jgi:hypothetical protein
MRMHPLASAGTALEPVKNGMGRMSTKDTDVA